jgi:hypothetical protein
MGKNHEMPVKEPRAGTARQCGGFRVSLLCTPPKIRCSFCDFLQIAQKALAHAPQRVYNGIDDFPAESAREEGGGRKQEVMHVPSVSRQKRKWRNNSSLLTPA